MQDFSACVPYINSATEGNWAVNGVGS
jgi:hypothetical protein